MFKGSIVALITPFRDGKVDEKAFQSLVEWQIDQGTDGLVPVGTTGESPTLSHAEHRRVRDELVGAQVVVARARIPTERSRVADEERAGCHGRSLARRERDDKRRPARCADATWADAAHRGSSLAQVVPVE